MKKVLLGSLVLAGMVSACTNEEVLVPQENSNLGERTQVNLTITAPEVESRMTSGAGWDSGFETTDVLGAVLVDKGYTAATSGTRVWNNVDWTVVNGHVGNNKWSYNKDKVAFETAGTTSVGSWLFYTKYNEKMTTTRNGVEFDFPQIQEGATNLDWVMNNNANFMVSPVVHLDGYEGQKIEFEVKTASVFTSLRMPFDMSATGAESVQKIVVKAQTASGVPATFPLKYRVVNQLLPEAKMVAAAGAPVAIACPRPDVPMESLAKDWEDEMQRAYDEMIYSSIDTDAEWNAVTAATYKKVVESRAGDVPVSYLVVDLDGEHTDKAGNGGLAIENGKFDAVMLMPAGVYYDITFDIYTDKGIWTVTVDDRNEYIANIPGTTLAQRGLNKIFLRPGRAVMLSDIENKFGNKVREDIVAEEYIKVTTQSTNLQYITKTADLINLINGITAGGNQVINVISQALVGGGAYDDESIPEHSVIVNQAVMDAIELKEAAVGDIQLQFKGATIKVKGNDAATSQLNIHDLTFDNGAEVISGYVKATSQVIVPAAQQMLVKTGADVEMALANASAEKFTKLNVQTGATVKVSTNSEINTVVNKGNFTVNENKTLTVDAGFTNDGIVSGAKGDLTVDGTLNVKSLSNTSWAALTNNGTITINGGTNSNAGSLTNNDKMNVQANFGNTGTITIAAEGMIHVNNTSTATMLTNEGTITNSGKLYTLVGQPNKITNLGTIDAKAGSTTYITYNSKLDETSTATNSATQDMGTIKIAERDLDVSVTDAKFQGYIEYTVQAADLVSGKFTQKAVPTNRGDKYNKLILSTATSFDSNVTRVNYIVTSADLILNTGMKLQEVTFTGDASLYAAPGATMAANAKIAYLNVLTGAFVKVPTENAVNVGSVQKTNSETSVAIKNFGEILVGGKLYTSLTDKSQVAGTGSISAGDGQGTAIVWSQTVDDTL